MFKNYFKSALRNLKQNFIYTTINILGLSIALAVSFIIILFVVNELSYNNCHQHKDKVYRVNSYLNDFKMHEAKTPFVMASVLKEDIPQVEYSINTRKLRNFKIKLKDDFVSVENPIGTSSEVFDIFTLPLIKGNNNGKLLEDNQAICLSESLAKKIFSRTDIIGEQIIITIGKTEKFFNVVAVYKDLPKNSTFNADCLINGIHTLPFINAIYRSNNADTDWYQRAWMTWIKLSAGSKAEQFNSQLKNIRNKYIAEDAPISFHLQNLSDIYLSSIVVNKSGITGNWKTIKIFIAIAMLIILVAVINYIILSTSVSSGRSKEIGIRKTFGAENKQVKFQFLLEAVFLSIIVLPIAVLLMTLGISQAEKLFQTQLPIINENIIYYIFIYLLLTILIGLISGLYTSVGLSRMNVIKVLKSGNFKSKSKNYFRTSLIIFQLVIFCFFIASTLIIKAQYQFTTKKNPGFINKNILLVNINDLKLYAQFLNEVRANSNVISASGAKEGLPMHGTMSFSTTHQKNQEDNVIVEAMAIDFQFLETMGIKLHKGRYLSAEFGSDRKKSCIINEAAVKALGIDEPIGCKLGNHHVVGVVKDFYPNSFRSEIPPLLIFISDKYLKQVVIKYKEGSLDDLLVALKESWNKLETNQEFNSVMIEDVITDLYSNEKNNFTIVSIIALFTMLISSLGLFGLTLFLIRGKTKEIGIKKILGCSERGIVLSFIRINVIHVFIASIISIPLTIYVMNKWLSNYAEKTEIEWWFFALTFLIANIVVITTIFFHSYKAARLNPVKSLKYE